MKIILLSVFASWCGTIYAINILDTHLYLTGYGGWHTLFHDDNQNVFLEGGASWSLSKYTHLHFTYNHFLFDYTENIENILTEKNEDPYKGCRMYRTGLYDLTAHYTVWNQSLFKIYFKAGLWALQTHIAEKRDPYYGNSKKNIFSKPYITKNNTTPIKQSNYYQETNYLGYGYVVGIGVNWLFLPNRYSALSADLSASAYIPSSSIAIIGTNIIPDIFPGIKVGVRWHVR